jgi:hypothetical protein
MVMGAVLGAIGSNDPPDWDGSTPLHLPTIVNAPGEWSDDEGPTGPLAALGLSMRTMPDGLTRDHQALRLFGVSAVDGRAAWVELPEIDWESRSLIGWFALSPDGRWIALSRERVRRRGMPLLVGWTLMDTVTGEVRELEDPDAPRLQGTLNDLAFSGDSRFLLTSYEVPDAPRTRGHQFVAWAVADGTPTVLEEPGYYWLPILGSAPDGVVWARGSTVYRAAPSGARTSYELPRPVLAASFGPDDTAFAYIGHPPGRAPWTYRLYAGRSFAEARDRPLPLDVDPGQILGWRDERHVVIGHYRTNVHVVDVVTGEVVELDMDGYGEQLNVPLLAADLWQTELRAPPEPDGTTDPRRPYRWGGGAVLGLLAGSIFLRRRRVAGLNRSVS